VFLLFGQQNGQALRTLGRWYGRAARLKQELLSELTRAADLPTPPAGVPLTVRGALLGLVPAPLASPPPPIAVLPSPILSGLSSVAPIAPWTSGYPVASWATTVSALETNRGGGTT